jgi:hypothetical protein
MPKKPDPHIIGFIAESAIARAHELPLSIRAELFDAIGDLLAGEASDEAHLAAFNLRETERHQLTLEQILRSAK